MVRELQNIIIKLHYLASKAGLPSVSVKLRKIADELSDLVA